MLDFPSTINLTSTPPLGETGRLLATLPPNVTGSHLKAVRMASGLSPLKFALLLGVSPEWLRAFEKGRPTTLSRTRIETQLNVALAMQQLGILLTKDGWELIDGGRDG
jgi:transcriptional regulator with XRE-family HTH domain